MIYFPHLNPIRIVPVNINANGNMPNFDSSFYDDLPTYNVKNTYYTQKWQHGDTILFQITCDDPNLLLVEIVSCENGSVTTINKYSDTSVANNLIASFYKVSISNSYIGRYVIRVTYSYNAIAEVFMSEPMNIREAWDNTMIVKYRSNRYDVFDFHKNGTYMPYYYIRIKAMIIDFKPNPSDESWENDRYINKVYYGKYARKFNLWMKEIPDWMVEKFAMIFTLDDIVVNGKKFLCIKPDEISVSDYAYLRELTIPLVDLEDNYSYSQNGINKYSNNLIIMSAQQVANLPFVMSFTINGITQVVEKVINSSHDISLFLGMLHTLSAQFGANIHFYIDNDDNIWMEDNDSVIYDINIDYTTEQIYIVTNGFDKSNITYDIGVVGAYSYIVGAGKQGTSWSNDLLASSGVTYSGVLTQANQIYTVLSMYIKLPPNAIIPNPSIFSYYAILDNVNAGAVNISIAMNYTTLTLQKLKINENTGSYTPTLPITFNIQKFMSARALSLNMTNTSLNHIHNGNALFFSTYRYMSELILKGCDISTADAYNLIVNLDFMVSSGLNYSSGNKIIDLTQQVTPINVASLQADQIFSNAMQNLTTNYGWQILL